MSAQEELKEADNSAVDNVQQPENGFNSRVTGGSIVGASGGKKKKLAGAAATAAIVIIIVLSLFLFLGGNYYIDAIQTRFVEVTDTQYADAVQSKELVFQKALKEGKIPINTFNRLKEEEVLIGYLDGETFVESNVGPVIEEKEPPEEDKLGSLSVKMGDKIISADDFYYEINHNIKLYEAFTKSTYGRAAYYYDDKAQQVFEKVGIAGSNSVATTRNNFTENEDFETTMDKLIGDENPVGFDDQTWHYMPLYSPDESCQSVLSGWEKVTDEFSCTGTNVTKIATWRDQKFTPICIPTGVVDENGVEICAPSCVPGDYEYFYSDYGCNGESAESYIKAMSQANMSKDDDVQTIKNTTDSLKAADTLSMKQKSMRLYSGFMEAISRTKAGYGSYNSETDKIMAAFSTFGATTGGSHVNDVMNAMFEVRDSIVVDVTTGEEKLLTGSMMEAPSVYAILTGEKVDLKQVADFSSDRILKTIQNNSPEYTVDDETMLRTATNKKNANESTIGRYTPTPGTVRKKDNGEEVPAEFRDYTPDGSKIVEARDLNYNHGDYSTEDIGLIKRTVQNSLYNTFSETNGIYAGQVLADGALHLGAEFSKASGGAPGDGEAVLSYLRLTSDVLAMDAEVDRMNRSPLDITSKNTFLGSLVYKFAVSSLRSGSFLNKIASFSRITNKAVASILPAAFAEEESDSYLSTFGDCDTLSSIGAVGSPTCTMIATFDVSTYTVPREVASTEPYVTDVGKNDLSIYESSEFQSFIEDNVTCDVNNKNCEINDKEQCKKIFGECNDDKVILAKYVTFNENRNTPVGLTDASLVENQKQWENMNQSWFKRTWASITSLFGLIGDIDDGDVPDEATGKEFVYKASNGVASAGDEENMWNKYKYAQRYISLARAAEAMRQYDGDETAYVFDGFGTGDPVARYMDKLNQTNIASK